MKIVKSKLSIAILSVGFISAIGAISYAALNREVRNSSPVSRKDSVALNKKAHGNVKVASNAARAPHQDEIENYLESMKGFLQTPPRDGVFGGDRIPTLHGKEADGLESFNGISSLDGELQLRSAVVGLRSDQDLKDMSRVAKEEGKKSAPLTPADGIRVTDVHYLGKDSEDSSDSEDATLVWEANTKLIQQFGIDIRKKGVETLTQSVIVKGVPGWIVGSAVHASVNSCYKCHSNIKKGDPIGYTVALYSKAKS